MVREPLADMLTAAGGCHLVPFDHRHSDATRRWANDPALARLLDRARPVSQLEHDEWMRAVLTRTDALFFAVENDARHVGNVWLWSIDPRHRKAEVRIVLGDEGATGHGIGTEALALIARYAFGRMNLHRLYAYVLGGNHRACRAFEKAGFAIEGTLRADRWVDDHYEDVFLLGRVRDGAARTDAVRTSE
jgi:RimJ/RimL family protein N-acetyltransferase